MSYLLRSTGFLLQPTEDPKYGFCFFLSRFHLSASYVQSGNCQQGFWENQFPGLQAFRFSGQHRTKKNDAELSAIGKKRERWKLGNKVIQDKILNRPLGQWFAQTPETKCRLS